MIMRVHDGLGMDDFIPAGWAIGERGLQRSCAHAYIYSMSLRCLHTVGRLPR